MKKNKIIIITDLVVATLFLTTIIFQKNIEEHKKMKNPYNQVRLFDNRNKSIMLLK